MDRRHANEQIGQNRMNNAAVDGSIYHNGRTYAEQSAWLDSLEGDEYRIVHMPSGHLFNLAHVSLIKRRLLKSELPIDIQIRALETITGCAFRPVTAEAIQAIEPCCDIGAQMLKEIHSLDRSQQFRAFREGDVFRLMAKLNPSLLRALELCQHNHPLQERRSTALEYYPI
jgi:hypothetical protein